MTRFRSLAVAALAVVSVPAAAPAAVFQLSTGTSSTEVIASPGARAPKLDPSGQHVVYLGDTLGDDVHYLYSARLAGGDPIFISPAGQSSLGDDVDQFEIAPDGSFVAMLFHLSGGPDQLYMVPIEGGPVIQKSHTLPPGAAVTDFAISSDSQWLVYRAGTTTNHYELYRVPVGGSTQEVYGFNHTGTCDPVVQNFVISPDSTTVAFRVTGSCDGVVQGVGQGLYRAPIEGTSAAHAYSTLGSGFISQFEFANPLGWPNPALLLFIADPNGGLDDTAPAELLWNDGSALAAHSYISGTIAIGGNVISFHPVPQSQKVAFFADRDIDEQFELFLTTAGVPSVVQVPAQLHEGYLSNVREPYAVSNDGARVVFVQDDNPISSVDFEYLRSASVASPGSTTILEQVPVPGQVLGFEIASDSSRVVLWADRDVEDQDELFSVPIGGGAVAKLNPTFNPIGNAWDVTDFALSPDGSRTWLTLRDDTDFPSVSSTEAVYSVPTGGGTKTAMGLTIDLTAAEGFDDLLAPLDAGQVVSLGSALPARRHLRLHDFCLLCDGFEGTGDGLARWN